MSEPAEIIGLLALALGGLCMFILRAMYVAQRESDARVAALESRVAVVEARSERGHDDGK